MFKAWLSLFIFFAVAATVGAAPGAVRCAHLLDVRSGEIRDDQTIVFAADGTITTVGSTQTAVVPAGITPVILTGTCLPGLIDVHTHLTDDPQDSGY
jgi:imidazolonepropionase-like amidohydrolase